MYMYIYIYIYICLHTRTAQVCKYDGVPALDLQREARDEARAGARTAGRTNNNSINNDSSNNSNDSNDNDSNCWTEPRRPETARCRGRDRTGPWLASGHPSHIRSLLVNNNNDKKTTQRTNHTTKTSGPGWSDPVSDCSSRFEPATRDRARTRSPFARASAPSRAAPGTSASGWAACATARACRPAPPLGGCWQVTAQRAARAAGCRCQELAFLEPGLRSKSYSLSIGGIPPSPPPAEY